jgi:hypothetical protein
MCNTVAFVLLLEIKLSITSFPLFRIFYSTFLSDTAKWKCHYKKEYDDWRQSKSRYE